MSLEVLSKEESVSEEDDASQKPLEKMDINGAHRLQQKRDAL